LTGVFTGSTALGADILPLSVTLYTDYLRWEVFG
jgi:hypothetical protein